MSRSLKPHRGALPVLEVISGVQILIGLTIAVGRVACGYLTT